jgi:hypothetical protein
MATVTQRDPANSPPQSKNSSAPDSRPWISCNGQGLRLIHPTVDFGIAVVFVVLVIYGFGVAIQESVEYGAARRVFDSLVRETCSHPVPGCRLT